MICCDVKQQRKNEKLPLLLRTSLPFMLCAFFLELRDTKNVSSKKLYDDTCPFPACQERHKIVMSIVALKSYGWVNPSRLKNSSKDEDLNILSIYGEKLRPKQE